ncbi:MAG: HmuY family protein [Leptospiraceae bacterium]|nr:HmuY family protein [Leptospiraceae bacterium]
MRGKASIGNAFTEIDSQTYYQNTSPPRARRTGPGICTEKRGRAESSIKPQAGFLRSFCGLMSIALLVSLSQTACRHPAHDDNLQALLDVVAPQDSQAGSGSCSTVAQPGFNETVVQATSQVEWTHCDLSIGATTTFAGPWDIRFRRFATATHGGSTASGSGAACNTGLTDLGAATSFSQFSSSTSGICPNLVADSQLTASSGGQSGSSSTAFSGSSIMLEWYNYDSETHVLSAKSEVYVVRSSDGADYYAIQFQDYYSEAGTSGFPTIRWKRLNP